MTTETRTAHTPGPWHLGSTLDVSPTDRDGYEVWEVRPLEDANGVIIALISDADANRGDSDLLKAAPDLLAALEAIISDLYLAIEAAEYSDEQAIVDRRDVAVNAIAKARGNA